MGEQMRASVHVTVREDGWHVRATCPYPMWVSPYDWAMEHCRRTLKGWARIRFEAGLTSECSRLTGPSTQEELALAVSVCLAWCDEVNERREELERTADAVVRAMGLDTP